MLQVVEEQMSTGSLMRGTERIWALPQVSCSTRDPSLQDLGRSRLLPAGCSQKGD